MIMRGNLASVSDVFGDCLLGERDLPVSGLHLLVL